MLRQQILKELRDATIDNWIDSLDKDDVYNLQLKLIRASDDCLFKVRYAAEQKIIEVFYAKCKHYLEDHFNYSHDSNIVDYKYRGGFYREHIVYTNIERDYFKTVFIFYFDGGSITIIMTRGVDYDFNVSCTSSHNMPIENVEFGVFTKN